MARTSYYTVYVLFQNADERAQWEARLPKPDLTGEAAPEACDIKSAAALDDGEGGFYEGDFIKVLGRREDLVRSIIELAPQRCFEPRKDGFVWQDMARICTGDPAKFAREHVKRRRSVSLSDLDESGTVEEG
ncbi:MAG: hypothetical protein FJX35_23280 [Alphaproteobacteria bacterium]|nr:hypothetical protein [Alphaproteobacteria bacterium]